ncbi:MAG TPA: hypothetical protein VKR06_33630 [Ktedonosporobacter sp.]|nr:hypothetical protein [Ktedonosporobacter sp.]
MTRSQHFSRRKLLKAGAVGAVSTTTLLGSLAWMPQRVALARPAANLPNVQFDLGNFIPPAFNVNDGAGNVLVRFGPVFTMFLTMQLTRFPSLTDFQTWHDAIERIESVYPFSPSGVFTIVSYGVPYFNRLPASLVKQHMPTLISNSNRPVLEEAVASPTDFPNAPKKTFQVNVNIEQNDVLVTLRSDSMNNLNDVSRWLQGSNTLNGFTLPSPAFNGLFTFTSSRIMFQQIGLPRKVANSNNLPFAARVNPDSPMWMGFLDQQVSGSGPTSIVTFQGNSSAQFANLPSGYFTDGSIQHLSHVIQDLAQFYGDDEPFSERVQYMFRSDPIPTLGNGGSTAGPTDPSEFNNGGGPSYLANDASIFLKYQAQGVTEASQTGIDNVVNGQDVNPVNDPQPAAAGPGDQGIRRPRMGHLSALQQSSRAHDGTPIHIRMDGPGFDSMDVPDGSNQAKLQFTVFVPTADFFATMRANQAALRFQGKVDASGNPIPGTGVHSDDNGLERFLTATRRQNFLCPPRGRRAFPLREFLP